MEIDKKSIQQLADKIETENKLFNSLTANEKKVIIAQDCLIRIHAQQIIPYCGMFLNNSSDLRHIAQPIQSQLNTPEVGIHCEACAKGSLFLSYIGRVNQFNPSDLENGNHISDPQHQKLLEVFTEQELAYIEFAFEGEQYIKAPEKDYGIGEEPIIFTEEEKIKAKQFYVDYGGEHWGDPRFDTFSIADNEGSESETESRLIAICLNIIKNKGEFIL
jgi:hypothetical protein